MTKAKTSAKATLETEDGVEATEKTKGRVQPIVIKPLQVLHCEITIVGDSPLLVNNFDAKVRQELDDSYQEQLTSEERKLKRKDKTRVIKTPDEEYRASLYLFAGDENRYGIPAAALKNCAVSAAILANVATTTAKRAFHIVGDTGGLIEILGPSPVMDERIVRVGPFGSKKPATRRRARFDVWEIKFIVSYRADLITPTQLGNLYASAGFSVGLCEYRPEKSGNLGMFSVKRG